MRETNFIRQNKEKWKEFEQNLELKSKDPDKLNDQFVQITDDLSYSRTFYPNRSVRVYLNGLAQKIFLSIYKNKKSHRKRLIGFWTHELPQLVYESKNEFRLSFWVFLTAAIIGGLSCAMDPEFVRIVLSDQYVNMTLENIESGDPMAVYKSGSEFGGFLGITANNLYVAFLTFVSGVFFAIATLGILIQNGIMVGAFQYFFFEQGIYAESVLTIWMHGAFEISAIVIAGAAGLTMGRGLVFPGTLSRIKAFQISARRGVKIMIGIIPLFITAGFIEGYITRHTEIPDVIRALFILLCFAYVIGYFVIYPVWLSRKGFEKNLNETKLMPDADTSIDFSIIKKRESIFSDAFLFYRKYFWKLFWTALGMAFLYCVIVFTFSDFQPLGFFGGDIIPFETVGNINQFFYNTAFPPVPVLNLLIFSIIIYVVYTLFIKEEELSNSIWEAKSTGEKTVDFGKIVVAGILLQAVILTQAPYTVLLILLSFPYLFLWLFTMTKEDKNIFSALQRTFSIAKNSFGRLFGLFFIFSIISLLFFLLLDTPFLWSIFQFIAMNFSFEQSSMDLMAAIMMTFATMLLLYLEMILFLIGTGLLYYTLVEIKEAPSLTKKIQHIGMQRRIRGLERES